MFLLFLRQYESRSRLERFSGSSSISSADLFDDPKKQAGEEDSNYPLWRRQRPSARRWYLLCWYLSYCCIIIFY